VIPLTALAITIAMQWTMALLSTAVLLGSGLSAGTMWSQLWSFQWMLLYHLLTVHALWYAPIYAWLLLASAWAKRASFLWAGLPPLALAMLEKIPFGTTHFFNWLAYRFTGPEQFGFPEPGRAMQNMVHLSLGRFLSTPGLWAGLLLAAIFLAAAVRVRRVREPI
jgi:ABC-2 type transport system permease protein